MRRAVLSLISLLCIACAIVLSMAAHAVTQSVTGSETAALIVAIVVAGAIAAAAGMLVRKARQDGAAQENARTDPESGQ